MQIANGVTKVDTKPASAGLTKALFSRPSAISRNTSRSGSSSSGSAKCRDISFKATYLPLLLQRANQTAPNAPSPKQEIFSNGDVLTGSGTFSGDSSPLEPLSEDMGKIHWTLGGNCGTHRYDATNIGSLSRTLHQKKKKIFTTCVPNHSKSDFMHCWKECQWKRCLLGLWFEQKPFQVTDIHVHAKCPQVTEACISSESFTCINVAAKSVSSGIRHGALRCGIWTHCVWGPHFFHEPRPKLCAYSCQTPSCCKWRWPTMWSQFFSQSQPATQQNWSIALNVFFQISLGLLWRVEEKLKCVSNCTKVDVIAGTALASDVYQKQHNFMIPRWEPQPRHHQSDTQQSSQWTHLRHRNAIAWNQRKEKRRAQCNDRIWEWFFAVYPTSCTCCFCNKTWTAKYNFKLKLTYLVEFKVMLM